MDSLFSTVITSALVATIAGAAINAWLDARKSRHSTRLDALRAAVALEGYAITCADKISEHEDAVASDGHSGTPLASVPNVPELSVGPGFLRPRRAAVVNQLLIFPQEVRQADQAASFWWDVVGDMDATRNEAVWQTARMGLHALNLASDIRKAFALPRRELIFGEHNVRGLLDERHSRHA